jgi:SAM-dependent methyltransferase
VADPTTPACRVCNHPTELWGRKRGLRDVTKEFTLWRCPTCDLRLVEPVTGPEIYDADYYAGRGVDPLVDYAAEYANYRVTPRLSEFEDLAALAENYLSRRNDSAGGPVAWFDYGCGAGGLMAYLTDLGTLTVNGVKRSLQVSGFDIGSYADRLRSDGRQVETVESLKAIPPGSFDVITLIEVVEHLERPLEILANAAQWLRPGGLLLLTTGNLACPLARLQGVGFAYCLPEIHVTLWTPKSLEVAYTRVGLQPYRVTVRGSLRFKVRKNLARVPVLKVIEPMWLAAPALSAFDWAFGVSAMPMAIKPGLTGGTPRQHNSVR